jgi:hypothetical protein
MGVRLFTMILDFRGGTYFSQVVAADERDAVSQWAEAFRNRRPLGRTSRYLATAVERAVDWLGAPVAIEGLTGCWCHSASCGGDLVLLDIIESAMAAAGPPRCD